MITALILAACTTAAVLTGRTIYARGRAFWIREQGLDWHDDEHSFVVPLGAILGGIFFPLGIFGLLIFWNPRKGDEELRLLAKRQEKRIKELEKEAGFGQR